MKDKGYELQYAKTGVFQLNRVENIWDEIAWGKNVIDITDILLEKQFYDELTEKYNVHHEQCLPEDYNFDEDPFELIDLREKDNYMDYCDYHTHYINYIPDPEYPGEYIPDPNAEYSAYIGETDGFITQSRYVCKAAPGSICIPHQCCLDDDRSPKTEWAFTLPPELWGDDLPEGMEIIKVDKGVKNLTGILLKLGGV